MAQPTRGCTLTRWGGAWRITVDVEEQELTYRGVRVSTRDINDDIAAFWREYESGEAARRAVAEAGIDTALLDSLDSDAKRQAVVVEPPEGGLDPLTLAILVKFGLPVGAAVAIDLWRKVLLPRVERKWGAGAMGEEVQREK